MPSDAAETRSGGKLLDVVRRELAARLEARRAQLSEEISGYPQPIPACDAQFNYLLEARREVARELATLNDAAAASRSPGGGLESIRRLIEESAFLDDDARNELRSRLEHSS